MSSILNSVALYLALALGLILAGVALLSLRNPIIGKLGVRNIPRRPTQSALIVFGLTLSTMIIVSALSLGTRWTTRSGARPSTPMGRSIRWFHRRSSWT